ncbi:MAG: outer membrane protein assembly factor BamB [Sulfuricella sp.]|jgi:outer membrane protein assembly factor BamB|nr:outer membrane protein assembly factor BamB [Sulfuricella sp.]
MRPIRWLLVLAIIFQLAGCGGMGEKASTGFGLWGGKEAGEKPATLVEFKPSAELKPSWQERVGGAGDTVLFPAVVSDSIYAAGLDGKIARFSADTGKQQWSIDSGRKISGGVGADSRLVAVGTAKGEVLAFDAQGQPLWQARLSSEILSAPQVANDIVVVRTGDGRIFGLDARDGKRKWVYQRAMPVLALRSNAGVVVAHGAVFAGFAGGKLVALNLATGNMGWEATVALPRGATELERVTDVSSLPVVDGRMVCATAYQGRTACFDNANGNLLWARDVSSYAGLAMDDRYVYVSDTRGAIHALDKSSGASLWKQDKLLARQATAPLALGRYIAVADVQGYVHLLAREDGSFAARLATDGSLIGAPPVALTKGFLVQTRNGGLYALTVQ